MALVCKNCGRDFQPKINRNYIPKFCSRSCNLKYHTNLRKKRILSECNYCGKNIEKIYCHFINQKLHFCNHECHKFYQKEHPDLKFIYSKKSNFWNKGNDSRLEYKCKFCNNLFKSYHKSKFCSRNCFFKFNKGPNNKSWKGGKTIGRNKINHSPEYKLWRKSVFKRDDYSCWGCLSRGNRIESHHINIFSKYPDEIFDINNGITLCKDCHDLTRSWERLRGDY